MGESETNHVTLQQFMENMDEQFRKLTEQNEAGETMRPVLEKKVGDSSKVIADRTSGAIETKGGIWTRAYRKLKNV